MKKLMLFVFVLIAIAVGGVMAQEGDGDTLTCDASMYAALLQEGIDRLNAGDDPTEVMQDIDLAIGNARAECAGWVFTSDEYGLSTSVGPFTLVEGVYIVAFEGSEMSLLSTTLLSDGCGFDIEFLSAFGAGSQSVDVEGDCDLLVDVTSFDEAWSLQFERVR